MATTLRHIILLPVLIFTITLLTAGRQEPLLQEHPKVSEISEVSEVSEVSEQSG